MNQISYMNYFQLSLVSVISALFSYLFLFYLGNYIILYFAYDFDIEAFFDISGVHFMQEQLNPLWTFDARLTIFLSKPILSLIIAIISLLLTLIIKNLRVSVLITLLWLNIFAFNACFGIFIDDIITQKGLFFVVETMELSLGTMILLTAVTLFFMIRIGMVNATIFSLLLPNKESTKNSIRIIAIIILIIIPAIISFVITYVLTGIYHNSGVHLKILSSFIIIAVLFFYKGKSIKTARVKALNITKLDWILSLIFLILSVIMYLHMLHPISLVS